MGTSGSEGGQQKPTSRKTGTALLPDPYSEYETSGGIWRTAGVADYWSKYEFGWH
jgi:hypothetical protein